MTAILQTRSAKTCWPSCASICAGPWTSLFSCCPQTIRSVRILSREVAEDVLGSSDERNGKDDWIDLSAVADSSGGGCAICSFDHPCERPESSSQPANTRLAPQISFR